MRPDIAIVGGGVIGLGCAWRLAQRGVCVALFESGNVGQEASWAAAGMLAPLCEAASYQPGGPGSPEATEMLWLCQSSRDQYAGLATELRETTGTDVELSLAGAVPDDDWRRPGFRYYVTRPDDAAPESFAAFEKAGQAVRRREVERAGGGEAGNVSAAAVGPDYFDLPREGQVENRRLVQALHAATLSAGVVIHQNSPVDSVQIRDGRASAVVVGGTAVPAGNVLVCAGAWSGCIGGIPAEWLPRVQPVRGQMLALRGRRQLKQVIYSSAVYLVPRRDGRILVGATMEELGFDKTVTADARQRLFDEAISLVPDLADCPIEAHWAGLRPGTADRLPILGRTPVDNVFVATGHFRNGILLTPATARLMTSCILDGAPVPEAFRLERFFGNKK